MIGPRGAFRGAAAAFRLVSTAPSFSRAAPQSFLPGHGTPGNAMSGFGSFVSGVSGMGRLGADDGLKIAGNAVVAPQFDAGQPGIYTIDVKVIGVPMSESTDPYFDVANWNQSLVGAGYGHMRVTKVAGVFTGDASNPRSSGGVLDVFGAGVAISDPTFRLTIEVYGKDSAGPPAAGMGVAWAPVLIVAGVVIVINLVVYALSGKDFLVMGIKYVGKLLGVTASAIVEPLAAPVVGTAVVVIGIAALALFVMNKGGAKIRTPVFSAGK